MSTHTVRLSEALPEADAVECLGRVLSRYFDALPDWYVSAMVRTTRNYAGAFGHSEAFSFLDEMAPQYGIVWTLTDDSVFVVEF
jgi:hypothetical protein